MKTTRRIASLLLALVMVIAMAAPVWAAEGYTITINHASGTYAAYQVFAGDLAQDQKTLSNIVWGSGVNGAALLEALTTEKIEVDGEEVDNPEYIAAFADCKSAADVAEILAENKDDSEIAKAFAAVVGNYLTEFVAGTGTNTVTVEDAGYYFLKNTGVPDEDGVYTRYILCVVADTTVSHKGSVPTLDKEVEEKNDSTDEATWGETADYDVGDTINYKLTGTLSDQYADYLSYYYCFSDTMSDGLKLDTESIVITVNGIDITESFNINATASGFTAASNLKEISAGKNADGEEVDVTISATNKIIVTYSATLTEAAKVGAEGNKNEAGLSYNNDPYFEGDGDGKPTTPDEPDNPGETPKDTTIVFTYKTIVNKVDEEGETLEGAGFTLYKWYEEDEEWVVVGDEITGETTFVFSGLDAGKYKLEETTVPDGYNKAEDIIFYIESTLNDETETLDDLIVKDESGNTISGEDLTFTADKVAGSVTTDVENKAGVILPSTGGIGTTIFYVVGGLLVAAAVVLLVTKRRMGDAE